jgi:hypothetical protein
MTGLRNNIIYLLLTAVIVSCSSKKEMDREAYLSYLNSDESGLIMKKTFSGITYKLKCLTPEQLCLRFNGRKTISRTEYDSQVKEYSEQLSFVMLLQDEKGGSKVRDLVFNKGSYGEALNYANSEMNKHIQLETTPGIIESGLVHLESANSLQPVLRISISFSGIKNMEDGFTLIFNDNIFNNGPIKFNYSKQVLEELPKLNI